MDVKSWKSLKNDGDWDGFPHKIMMRKKAGAAGVRLALGVAAPCQQEGPEGAVLHPTGWKYI